MITCRLCGRAFRWRIEGVFALGIAWLTCPFCECTTRIETVELPRGAES